MANNNNTLELHVFSILKGNVNEKTLIQMIDIDADFSENEEYFRDDTISLGYTNESERISKEFFEKLSVKFNDEQTLLSELVNSIFNIDNFILNNENDSQFEITETLDKYVVSIALVY